MTDELRDERLSRLYREASAAEPPAALDAAILAAARAEVKPKPARRAGWRRWGAPAGLAATLVLTVTLTLLVRQEQALRDEALPAAPPAPAVTPAPGEAMAPPAASSADPSTAPVRPRTVPPLREAERRAPAPMAAPPQPAPALHAAPQPSAESKSLQAAPAAEDAADIRAKREAPRKEAAAGAARAPEPWIEEIRQLRRQGKEKEAAEALAAFRNAYPDFRLPDDLR